ncbi:MAG: hypothetical protein KDJ37_17550 [Hyphomicrobiaceae bacterium]|nr:hypothetical protein [Hyphomicrobiaceae bacterium]
MRTTLMAAAIATVAACVAGVTGAAAKECRPEVEAAFAKQRATKGYRLEVTSASPQGETQMKIDYQTPDRMHQTVTAPGHPAPIETIAIAKWAWGTMGGGWEELKPQFAQSITSHVHETLVAPQPITASFECAGSQSVDGRTVRVYRTEASPGAPKDGQPPLTRTIHVDAESGLPLRNVVAQSDGKAPAVFDARYSYPENIAVDAPIGGPATRAP